MITAAVLALILLSPQQPFTQFTYCRQNPSGSFESLCIQLDPEGNGEARFKRVDDDALRRSVTLSQSGKAQYLSVLSATKYLADSKNYESKRKVADLGLKHLTLESASGRREAEFNYSDLKEVNALVSFFESLLTQEALVVDLEWAVKFDPLGIPDRLDQIDRVMKSSRFADPKNLTEVLDIVDRDDHIVNYARSHARELKARLALIK